MTITQPGAARLFCSCAAARCHAELGLASRALKILFVAVMALSACASGSSAAQDQVASETAAVETPVLEKQRPTEEPTTVPTEAPAETPTEEPTPEPEPLSDTEMIALARTTFDADTRPGELIAWDHLSAEAFGDTVRLEICSWTGETVFDNLVAVEYQIQPDGTANYIFHSPLPGDCLNTELINSALAFTREFDTYWASVLEDPTTFDLEIDRQFGEEKHLETTLSLVSGWVDEGVHWESHSFDGELPGSTLRPIAWRSFDRPDLGFEVLELVSCREVSSRFGLYLDDVLIDDQKATGAVGSNVIHTYQLTRAEDQWLVAGMDGVVWADCFAQDWLSGLNDWKPEPAAWDLLP